MADGYWQALDELLAKCELVIDRPKGSAHPKFPSLIYPLDYGYLDGTSMDGDGIDVWVGSLPEKALNAIVLIVDLAKNDSEVKLLLGCSDEDTQLVLDVQNQGSMSATVVKRPTE